MADCRKSGGARICRWDFRGFPDAHECFRDDGSDTGMVKEFQAAKAKEKAAEEEKENLLRDLDKYGV